MWLKIDSLDVRREARHEMSGENYAKDTIFVFVDTWIHEKYVNI